MYSSFAIDTNGNGFIYTQSMSNVMTNHYVTITGVVIDYQEDRCWLKVQTWGQVYYIDFYEFYNYETPEADYSTAESTIIIFQ